jgi:hypothetical protein
LRAEAQRLPVVLQRQHAVELLSLAPIAAVRQANQDWQALHQVLAVWPEPRAMRLHLRCAEPPTPCAPALREVLVLRTLPGPLRQRTVPTAVPLMLHRLGLAA